MEDPFIDPVVVAGYEAWYETEGRVADQLERGLLGQLLSGFPGARTALEIGVGTGHFARWLKDLRWQVVGLDRSAPMPAEAARRDGIALGEASALPFAASAFDVALMITWRTTLLPEFCPRRASRLPIGAFLGMRVGLPGRAEDWS